MSKRALARLLLLVVVISSCRSLSAFAARDSLTVLRLVNPITIDGKWTTTTEWSDTQRVSMYVAEGPESLGFLRVKNDDHYLYLLVDFPSDITPARRQTRGEPVHWCYDGVSVGIDKHAAEKNMTDEVDLLIQLRWLSGYDAPEAVTPPGAWIEGTMSYDATKDPDSQRSHAIYELAIPMQVFENPSAIRASIWDPSRSVNMHWPLYEGSWSSKYFGDLIFSGEQNAMTQKEDTHTKGIEFVILPGIAAVAVLLALLYFGKRRRVSVPEARA